MNELAIDLIKQHIPSLTDADEESMNAICDAGGWDPADLALRTCHCGLKIDGYYDYVGHLLAVLA